MDKPYPFQQELDWKDGFFSKTKIAIHVCFDMSEKHKSFFKAFQIGKIQNFLQPWRNIMPLSMSSVSLEELDFKNRIKKKIRRKWIEEGTC